MPARRRLVLFDIDGTLLSASVVFRGALQDALEEAFGVAGPLKSYDFSGKTDPQIVRELMTLAGVDGATIDAGLDACLDVYCRRLLSRLGPADVTAKPGVAPLVDALAADGDVTLGLLTGNLEPCARAKLDPLDLNRHFPFGAYGSDHESRERLATVAVDRAQERTGRRFAGKDVIIVGDSIHDVRCGRGLGVRAVAVATGRTTRERLAEECPDALLDSFHDTGAALAAIYG